MSRSTKKGPFIDAHLMIKIEAMNTANEKKVIRTWSRRSTIHPDIEIFGINGISKLSFLGARA